jgi:hypothetical protein
MADKLMRTFVIMSFFLVLALFSGCGRNETSLRITDNSQQPIVHPGESVTLTLE